MTGKELVQKFRELIAEVYMETGYRPTVEVTLPDPLFQYVMINDLGIDARAPMLRGSFITSDGALKITRDTIERKPSA